MPYYAPPSSKFVAKGWVIATIKVNDEVVDVIISELSIEIKQKLADVYAYLMNCSNYAYWQAGLVEVRATDGMNVGSDLYFTTIGLGKKFELIAHVTENDGVSGFRVVSNRGPVSFESTYRLEARGATTTVHLFNKIEANSVFKLAESVLQSISDSRYDADLHTLKAILEGKAIS